MSVGVVLGDFFARLRRNVRAGTFAAVGILLPRGFRLAGAAAAAVGPDVFVPAALVAGVDGEIRAADGDNAGEGRRVFQTVTVVARAGEIRHALGVVIRAIEPAARIAVGDDRRAELDRLLLGGPEIAAAAAIRFDEINGAVGATRRDHLDVKVDLDAPAHVTRRIVAHLTVLVVLVECADGQAHHRAIHGKVARHVRIVVGVNDINRRPFALLGRGQFIRVLEISCREAGAVAVDASRDQHVALRLSDAAAGARRNCRVGRLPLGNVMGCLRAHLAGCARHGGIAASITGGDRERRNERRHEF